MQNTQFDEIEQASELESGMLELSDQDFCKTMINMLKTLKEIVDNMQEQTDNVSREMEILKKNKK